MDAGVQSCDGHAEAGEMTHIVEAVVPPTIAAYSSPVSELVTLGYFDVMPAVG